MAIQSISGVLQYAGLSSDVKPTTGVPAGSSFLEVTLGSPNTVTRWFYDGVEWGKADSSGDITAAISGIESLLLIPQVASGTAVIDETLADWTAATDLIAVAPATGSPLRDVRLDLDLAKAATGFAALYAAQTLTLQVWRKTDGTNWLAEAPQTVISGTNSASRVFPLTLGTVGVVDAVKVTAKLSAENGGSTVTDIPYRLHYLSVTAPTLTVAAVAP